MEINDLLEPKKLYDSTVKNTHHDNVEAFFNDLVKKSKINIEENKATIKEIKSLKLKIDQLTQKTNGKSALKTFLIILLIASIIAGILLLYTGFSSSDWLKILLGFVSLGLFGLFIFLVVAISKSIKDLQKLLSKLNTQLEALNKKASIQMQPLNSLFDWNMSSSLFSKTIPLIQLDTHFDAKKYIHLHDKYGFKGNVEKNISTMFVQSGSILGNPFLMQRNYVQNMANEIYTGSLVISWTTTHRDSQGHVVTDYHTETLTASITKPKPYYYLDTWLVYGNEAAGNLSFSRVPSKIGEMNEKQLERYINSFDKKLDKMTQESISKGKNFQRMSDPEFEALFNALDRNNNVEFRLLFTPLAQKSMIELIKSKEPYGDDFHFVKRKSLNYIKTNHSQNISFDGNPANFYSNDYEEIRNKFLSYNDNYLKNMYFNLAPLMCIPLYQQHQDINYIYKSTLKACVTEMETEVLANSYDNSIFAHPESSTPAILKRKLTLSSDKVDYNDIYAYSFKGVKRVEYVSKYGGDGHYHNVPVEWIEYIPLEKVTKMSAQECPTNKITFDNNYRNGLLNEFLAKHCKTNGIMYQRGLISVLNSNEDTGFKGDELNKLLIINKEL